MYYDRHVISLVVEIFPISYHNVFFPLTFVVCCLAWFVMRCSCLEWSVFWLFVVCFCTVITFMLILVCNSCFFSVYYYLIFVWFCRHLFFLFLWQRCQVCCYCHHHLVYWLFSVFLYTCIYVNDYLWFLLFFCVCYYLVS